MFDRSPFISTPSEQSSEAHTEITQLHRTRTSSTDIYLPVPNNCDPEINFPSHDQLMDLLFNTSSSDGSSKFQRYDESHNTTSNSKKKLVG